MTSEETFRLSYPLAYVVNNVEDLKADIVKAFQHGNNNTINELTQNGETDFDVFICVNTGWHAFILCIPNSLNGPTGIKPDVPKGDAADGIMCWVFELVFENEDLRQYKIQMEYKVLRLIRKRIQKSYYIGKYMQVNTNAFQFAALRAAPHRYNVLLNDCVEFAKEFCHCLLRYCSNTLSLKRQVNENIKKATASGLSVEILSRRIRVSACIGNLSLGGLDAFLILIERNGSAGLVAFVLIYPLFVSFLTAAVLIHFLK